MYLSTTIFFSVSDSKAADITWPGIFKGKYSRIVVEHKHCLNAIPSSILNISCLVQVTLVRMVDIIEPYSPMARLSENNLFCFHENKDWKMPRGLVIC